MHTVELSLHKLVHTKTTMFMELRGKEAGMKLTEPPPVLLLTDNMYRGHVPQSEIRTN